MAQALVPLTHGKRGPPPLRFPRSCTHYDPDFLVKVAGLNGRVFDNDPVVAYMLLDMSQEERLAYLPTYWSTLVRSALMNGAIITEADGWKAASVIIPPGKGIDNVWTLLYAGFLCVLWRIGISGLKRLWTEFSGMTDNAKRKGLHGEKRYYYVFSIGTEYDHRGKGLAKEIMRYHQNIARSENLPIWLEATTPGSRHLYLSLGFQEIEEIILGKGKVGADAVIEPGGPGVSLWAMVWWPESSEYALKS
ncbi:Acyl-CoA N-acyltransferase [Penicillium manginii]|uniref:Acyl-CoA N-acyltransferase n=1 Tax=Penicillium manginii TaxID=203109 RepID=UPI0025476D68|nr:Acyl-CoA N-acyltransferase [Penicillium manginii]KAJ5750596.1 Acyl-CoA N-acyltransferase [Penicillium manginii]